MLGGELWEGISDVVGINASVNIRVRVEPWLL